MTVPTGSDHADGLAGIPVALVVAKSMGTCFNPINRLRLSQAVTDEMERRRNEAVTDRHLG